MHENEYCLIIGAARSGTSSLFASLRQCSKIAHSKVKELHIFDTPDEFPPTPEYLNRYASNFVGSGIRMEATPSYLFFPFVPQRIYKLIPQARFIVLLRNPIDRAFSHHAFIQRRNGILQEPLDFKTALASETNRIAKGYHERLIYSYLARGLYAEQLEHWFKWFPQNLFFIIKSEDYFANPKQIIADCLSFVLETTVELDEIPVVISTLAPHTVNNYGVLADSLRSELQEYFQPYNRCLCELLERDFAWE